MYANLLQISHVKLWRFYILLLRKHEQFLWKGKARVLNENFMQMLKVDYIKGRLEARKTKIRKLFVQSANGEGNERLFPTVSYLSHHFVSTCRPFDVVYHQHQQSFIG